MSSLNIKHIPVCIEKALCDAWAVQLQSRVSVVDRLISLPKNPTYHFDCISSISLNSTQFSGSLAIAFPKTTLLKVIELMLGEPCTALTSENSDAAGELLNIIYSSSRRPINEGGFDFSPALPTTVIGSSLSLSKENLRGHLLIYECQSESGPFSLILTLKKCAAENAGQKAS